MPYFLGYSICFLVAFFKTLFALFRTNIAIGILFLFFKKKNGAKLLPREVKYCIIDTVK